MKSSTLPYWLTLMVVVGVAYGGWKVYQVEHRVLSGTTAVGVSSERVAGPPVEDFTLTKSDSQPFHAHEMDGKVWVASFFFTECPSVCVRLNQAIRSLNEAEGLEDVQFVSISCDPSNDTPEVLASYAARFEADPARWIFCTAPDLDYVKRLGKDVMQLTVMHQQHSDYAVVIGRDGKVRGHFQVTDSAQLPRVRSVLLECLAEPAPEPPVADETSAEDSPLEETPLESLAP